MANWRKPEERASETVTFRLRPDERRMLDHVAAACDFGISDLLRSLIAARARELGLEEPPEPAPRRRPGRPPKRRERDDAVAAQEEAIVASSPGPEEPIASPQPAPRAAGTREERVEELIGSFVEHFGDRGEGTRRELSETVDFLTAPRTGGPILARDEALSGIDSRRLAAVRERIAAADLRLSRKNLTLTYLRMMLQFALKREGSRPAVNPVLDLEPFTARELGSWPAPPAPDGEDP
jgi:hypothetical protein